MQQKRPTEVSFTISDRNINPQALKREILTQVGTDAKAGAGSVIIRLRCESIRRPEGANWDVKSTPLNRQDLQEVTDVLRLVATSGDLTSVYNLVKAWVDARNGRKLKIKVGIIDVDATQMKEDDVLRIFKQLEERAD
jgi:hypothetical protein